MSGVCANCGDVLYCAECREPKQGPSLSAGVGLLCDFNVSKMPSNVEFMASAILRFDEVNEFISGKSVVSKGRAIARMFDRAARIMYDTYPPET
jgi:hypothetical protein